MVVFTVKRVTYGNIILRLPLVYAESTESTASCQYMQKQCLPVTTSGEILRYALKTYHKEI